MKIEKYYDYGGDGTRTLCDRTPYGLIVIYQINAYNPYTAILIGF